MLGLAFITIELKNENINCYLEFKALFLFALKYAINSISYFTMILN